MMVAIVGRRGGGGSSGRVFAAKIAALRGRVSAVDQLREESRQPIGGALVLGFGS